MNFKIFKNLKISIVHDYVLLLKQKKKKKKLTVNTWSKNLF